MRQRARRKASGRTDALASLAPTVLLTGLLAACGATGPSPAAPAPAVAPAGDPQSAYEPRSEPGEGQQLLQRMVGDFDVVKTFHGRDGKTSVTNGECRQTMIHDGRFLESKFEFQGPQGKSSGLGLVGFDPRSGQFTSVWTDSRSTRVSLRQSESPATADELVLHSRSLEPTTDARHSRTVTRVEDGGRRIVHRQYSAGSDGGGRLVMELLLTRKTGG